MKRETLERERIHNTRAKEKGNRSGTSCGLQCAMKGSSFLENIGSSGEIETQKEKRKTKLGNERLVS